MSEKKKKQTTLTKFGFSKKIEHNRKLVEVETPNFVSDVSGVIACSKRNLRFKSRQGLSMHIAWTHGKNKEAQGSSSSKSCDISTVHTIDRPQQVEQVDNRGEPLAKGTDEQVRCATGEHPTDSNIEDETTEKQTKTKQSGGANKRKKYDYIFKMTAIDLLDQGIPQIDIALQLNVDVSMISRWKIQRKEIKEGAASKHRQLFVKHRPGLKYSTAFSQLYSKMVASHTKGMRVTFAWLYTHVNKINSTINPSTARVQMSAMSSFIRRYKIQMRRVERKKRQDKQYFVPKIMKWHSTLREGLI